MPADIKNGTFRKQMDEMMCTPRVIVLSIVAAVLMLCLCSCGDSDTSEATCQSLTRDIESNDHNVFRPAIAKLALKAADEIEKYPKESRKAHKVQQQLLKEAAALAKARQKFLKDKLWGPDCGCTGPLLAELQS